MNIGARLVEEYRKIKAAHADEILLYQIGTFYKIMGEDARKVAAALKLKLFVTGEAEDPVPVCGFPKSGLDKYVGKLVRAGFSVAVVRQSPGEDGKVARVVAERIAVTRPAADGPARSDAPTPGSEDAEGPARG